MSDGADRVRLLRQHLPHAARKTNKNGGPRGTQSQPAEAPRSIDRSIDGKASGGVPTQWFDGSLVLCIVCARLRAFAMSSLPFHAPPHIEPHRQNPPAVGEGKEREDRPEQSSDGADRFHQAALVLVRALDRSVTTQRSRARGMLSAIRTRARFGARAHSGPPSIRPSTCAQGRTCSRGGRRSSSVRGLVPVCDRCHMAGGGAHSQLAHISSHVAPHPHLYRRAGLHHALALHVLRLADRRAARAAAAGREVMS